MTTSNTPNQRIDEIIDNALKQVRPVIKPENGTGIKGTDSAKLLLQIDLKSLFETMIDSMWLNKHIPTLNVDGKYMVDVDWLTAELTKGKAEVISKYFGENDER